MTARNLTRMLVALCTLLCMVSTEAAAQQRTITGKVMDAKDGSGIPGASITVKGTRNGTTASSDGSFSFSVAPNATTLVITAVGFTPIEVSIGSGVVNVTLQASAAAFDEVVVIGYGSQRKREVTGSIAKVTSEKLNAVPVPSFEAGLQGRATGVQVVQGSGLAGSGSVVRIRGLNSISAGGDPLYVVDGVPITQDPFLRTNSGAMNQNPLAAINPQDIESIEVLKDAAAAGIYGSRGANGVILVTTKRGKSGKPSFNYSNRIGVSTYANRPEFVNGPEWLALRQEAWQNDGNTGQASLPAGITWDKARQTDTDWWDMLTQNGFMNEHNLSMNVGSKKLRTFVSANYSKNESYIIGNSFERYGVRLNLDYTFNTKLKAGITSGWNRGVNNRVPAAWAGGLGDAMSTALPIYPVYKDDGSYWLDGANPYARLKENTWINTDDRVLASAYLEFSPIKNLTLKAVGSMDYLSGVEDKFETALIRNASDGLGFTRRSPIQVENMTGTFTAEYKYNISDEHRFGLLIGVEAQESKSEAYNTDFGTARATPWYNDVKAFRAYRDSMAEKGNAYWNETSAFTFNSFFGRLNYNFNDKFFAQFSARVDGSSRFGDNYKYGFFPSGAIGYVISEEDFIDDVSWIDYLKIRTSFGKTGNSNFGSGLYYTGYSVGGTYNNNRTLYLSSIGNPDLHWEEVYNFDLGADFTLFSNSVTGELSYYNRTTKDVLLNAGLSPSTGFPDGFRNVEAEIINQGVELGLNAKLIRKKDFEWSIGGNISKNYNEVKSLGGLSPDAIGGGTNDTRIAVGYPIGTNYLVRYVGVDQNDGLPIWLDASGKTTKTFSLDHRVPVGSVIPDYIGGFNTNVRYKGFELATLFTYTIGGNIYDGSGKRQLGIVTDWNIRTDIADRWMQPGDIAKFPRLTMQAGTYDGLSSEWQYNSTMFLHDASFLRLRELTLSYTLPSSMLERIKLRNARLFVTGTNILTWTKYPGGDPEIARDFENAQDRNLSPNVTYLTPPQQKSITFGLNLSF